MSAYVAACIMAETLYKFFRDLLYPLIGHVDKGPAARDSHMEGQARPLALAAFCGDGMDDEGQEVSAWMSAVSSMTSP